MQCGSLAAVVENLVHNLEPAMENEAQCVLESEEPAAGPSRVAGVILENPKESGDFKEVEGGFLEPPAEHALELVQFVIQEAHTQSPRIEFPPHHLSLVVVERFKLVDTQR